MSTPRAADLPVGSIIANSHTAWIKTDAASGFGSWLATGEELNTYTFVPQEALNEGAQVLRVGDGGGQ